MYARAHETRIKNHLQPFFGSKPISEISTGLIQQYRLKRAKPNNEGKIETWRRDYNEVRPHSAIGYNVPVTLQNLDDATNPSS